MQKLTTTDHSRDSTGMTYVYPVFSRRSGGLSIGINLNPNNACNWRCIYCQVPDLIRGSAPAVDLLQLEDELQTLLQDVLNGDFYARYDLPEDQRVIRDIALSGNGEPTSCPTFGKVIGLIGKCCGEFDLFGKIKLVLISNGSLMQKPEVQRGLAHWSELGGEVWFKLDSATEQGRRRINDVSLTHDTVLRNLLACSQLCPTWIQTCLFAMDGYPPAETEQAIYLDFLAGLPDSGIHIEGVLVYGLARPSLQPGPLRLESLPAEWLINFGQRIESLGVVTRVHS